MAQGPPRFSLRHTPGMKPLEGGFNKRIDVKKTGYRSMEKSCENFVRLSSAISPIPEVLNWSEINRHNVGYWTTPPRGYDP